MTKELRSRKWFCRISLENHLKTGEIYKYDFNEIYLNLIDRYEKVMYIIHDQDDKNIHAHFIIQHKNQIKKSTLINIMPYGDIEQQRGTNIECYNYLLHKDVEDKVSYSEENIVCNFSEEVSDWLSDKKVNKSKENFLNAIYNSMDTHEIREQYPNEFLINFNKLEKLQNDSIKEKSNCFRDIKVIYVYGNNLDLFLKPLCAYLIENDISYFHINDYDRDPFSNYCGEKIVISNLDDMIQGTFFHFNRLETFFSEYPKTQICSRYNNKYLIYDLIILTNKNNMFDIKDIYGKKNNSYLKMFIDKLYFTVSIDDPFIRLVKNGEVMFESGVANKTKLNEIISHIFYKSGVGL